MKRYVIFGAILLAGAGVVATVACKSKPSGEQAAKLYRCPMHPKYISDKPGNCPICNMKLVPVENESTDTGGHDKMKMGPGGGAADGDGMDMSLMPEGRAMVNLSLTRVAMGNIVTIAARADTIRKNLRLWGEVVAPEDGLYDVAPRFSGWVERLLVDETGRHVTKGQVLFTVYSPALYQTQGELMTALASGDSTFVEAARQKLRLADIAPRDIAEVERKGIMRTLPVRALNSGYVIEKNVVEGEHFPSGKRLYRIAKLSTVWVEAQGYEADAPMLRVGQEATVESPALTHELVGRVAFIWPTLSEGTRTTRVRVEVPNPGLALRPGATATVTLKGEPIAATVVPASSVLRGGTQDVIYVETAKGVYGPRLVKLGPNLGDVYTVLEGVKPGERVVAKGAFLVDAESQLNATAGEGMSGHQH